MGSSARRPAALGLEPLEDRDVPSAATLDLTTRPASGQINGAVFTQAQARPTGTGVIDSFVRVQAPGNATVEQGYNTSARPLAYDENKSPNFTRSLAVTDVPRVQLPDGQWYREFLLDINQKASSPLLSLDALKVYVSNNPAVSGQLVNGNLPDGTAPAYDLGANRVLLNARLSTGSGSGDMVLDVPEADLAGGTYLYLYSEFGATQAANGGFEEWAVQGAAGGPVVSDTSSISGSVSVNGFGAAPDGTVVNLVINGQVVDSVATVNGTYTFNNLLLNGTTTYTVDVPSFTAYGAATVDDSTTVTVAPGQTVTGVNLIVSQQNMG